MKLLSLQSKDVVDQCSGSKIGYVADIEINPVSLCIECLIVERLSYRKLVCLFKGPPHITIPISHIVHIGEDIILVRLD